VSSDEARARLDALAPTEAERQNGIRVTLDQAVWAVAFYAGARMGEIRALHRHDVIGLSKLEIHGGWDDREGLQATKTRAGSRSVPIIEPLRGILAGWLEQARGGPDDLLFPALRERGQQSFDPSALRRRTYRVWDTAGFDRIKPHHARHTFASWLIAAGVSLVEVSRYMGHSSSKVTERVYIHLQPDHAERNAEKVERYLNR
jgi:integrase